MRTFSAFALACLVLTACGTQSPTEPNPAITPLELRAAPSTIEAGGVRLTLSASLWRDFMPPSPQDGRPLIAIARVQTVDRTPVAATLRATDVWVVLGSDVWRAAFREERPRSDTAPDYEIVARDGPKWGPGVTADVVVRVTDGRRNWLLRAADQRIEATW
jgi:hypothetical protein